MEGGTGVFYQVMPAVGPDGKNVMKLIPVQKVNGQYIPMQTTSSKIDCLGAPTVFSHPVRILPPSLSQNRIPVVEPTADGKFILKGPTNTTIRLTKSPQQVISPKVLVGQVRLPVVPPKRTQNLVSHPVNASGTSIACSNTSQLPVTVSSPKLPNGHYLQIPPDAKVQTLPASALPQSIKKQILNLPHDMASTEKPSTVVYVSPVTSMKIDTSKLKDSAPPMTKCVTVNVSKNNSTWSPATPAQSPKVVDSDSVTPMKWVVQQKEGSSAPCLVPASPTCMTSEILKVVAQMKKNSPITSSPSSSQMSHMKISPSKDDALVMCNGKVYFVTNKDSRLCVSSQESHATAKEGSTPRKPTESPSSSSRSHTSGTQPNPKPICIDVDPDEVIDLCDDDPQTEGTSGKGVKEGAGVTTEEDDSNVIFVSYIPPKTSGKSDIKEECGGKGGTKSGQPIPVRNNSELTKQVSSENQHENCASGKQTGSDQDVINAEPVSGIKIRVDVITPEDPRLDEQELDCDAAQTPANCEARMSNNSNKSDNMSEMNVQNVGDGVHLNTSCSTVPEDSSVNGLAKQCNVPLEARTGPGIDGELASAEHGIQEHGMESKSSQENQVLQEEPSNIEDTVQMTETTSQDPSQVQSLTMPVNVTIKNVDQQSQHEYDCKMRRLFGIQKDIQICLKRSHSEKQEMPSETRSINKRTLEGIRRLIQGSQMEIKAKKLIEAQVHLAKDVKRRKVESSRNMAEQTSESQVAGQPHASPKCGLFNSLQSKINSLTADAGISTVLPVQNIVPSACDPGESASVSEDVLEGKALDTTKDTDRLASTGADKLALKEASADTTQDNPGEAQPSGSQSSGIPISTQPVTSGKSDLRPVDGSTGRDAPSQMGVEPPGSACENNTSTTEVLNKDLFSTEPMEPEEIKRCEKIKRLKELLKEKEAALEMMRKKMSM
ncbi:LOW QUALITY PROTEIN: ligand-dependent nuclear receptor-interacting factor 1 [Alosa alosa]|nr:LOW QUALITY PROTEIN: ligand-dependent nuclear receptor-interacting factor 1 [Alosa alosa]